MKSFVKYIILSCIFLSCTHRNHDDSEKISHEPLDTIKSIPPKIITAPALFETAFVKGTSAKVNGATFHLYGITIGNLNVESGHIIACDPLHIDEYGKPFTQLFPIGQFPVQLSIAKYENQELIAFVRINFSDQPVQKWELALLEGQKPLPLYATEIHGFSVDAGVGIYIDEEAKKALEKTNSRVLDSALFKEMDKHYHHTWRYDMYEFAKHNLASFTTGLGDGRYASYIGLDANGKPCRLLTDFNLFKWRF
jgi:hypothetical protein